MIPFRRGRIDAVEAGLAGVPQPQESLEKPILKHFANRFTQTEIIGRVACGHIVGGVCTEPRFSRACYTESDGSDNFKLFNNTPAYDNTVSILFIIRSETLTGYSSQRDSISG